MLLLRPCLALLAALATAVAAQEATLSAPPEAAAGSRIEVHWTGPGTGGDVIGLGPAGSGSYDTYAPVEWGSPAVLQVPSLPGAYDIHYVHMVPVTEGGVTLSTDAYALATLPLLVVPAGAAVPGGITLDAPASVPAGSVVDVVWSGPANDNDFIAVARPGGPPEDWAYYALTTLGSPARLLMPGEPGDWELRYQSGSDSAIFATRPITVH